MIRSTLNAIARQLVSRLMPRPSPPPGTPPVRPQTPPAARARMSPEEERQLRAALVAERSESERLRGVIGTMAADNARLHQEVELLQARWRDR
jgi:hypothetical protein